MLGCKSHPFCLQFTEEGGETGRIEVDSQLLGKDLQCEQRNLSIRIQTIEKSHKMELDARGFSNFKPEGQVCGDASRHYEKRFCIS